jgi:hypothetical protein
VDVLVDDHKAPQASSDPGLRAQGTGEGAGQHPTQQGLQGVHSAQAIKLIMIIIIDVAGSTEKA